MKEVAAIVISLGVLLSPTVLHDSTAQFSAEEEPISVLFVGDIMLDRAVAQYTQSYGKDVLFADVRELLASADVVVGNLEGSITNFDSVSQKDYSVLRFTFAPEFAQFLKSVGFTAVSLANNHTLDFGVAGYEQTLERLKEVSIEAFGYPLNNKNLSAVIPVQDKKLCLVGYHSLFTPDTVLVELEIARLRPQCDYVAVFAHWGEEYQHEPTPWQKDTAHTFVDLGADLVVGAHPHVVQPVEVYKNRAIFYSLGNFIFDQHFRPEVRRGAAVRVGFASERTTFSVTPVTTYKQVLLADAATAQAVLQDLGLAELSFELAK